MKKLLLTSILGAFVSTASFCQSVGDTPLKDITVEYVQIVGTSKLLSTKLTIEIDFGQNNKLFEARDTELRDSAGKKIVFNSMIDALNFMTMNGYEFVQAYTVTIQNQNVYHYLLKRKKV